MTPMDELRRLLDERGVKYDKMATVINGIVATFWHDRDGYPCSAIEGADDIPDGEVSFQACVTPEQAIAATLGRGECGADETETISVRGDTWGTYFDKHMTIHVMECSACGGTYEHVNGSYEFCPRCGAKVVDE